jgi:hypothetical protein
MKTTSYLRRILRTPPRVGTAPLSATELPNSVGAVGDDAEYARAYAHSIHHGPAFWPAIPNSYKLPPSHRYAPPHILTVIHDVKARAFAKPPSVLNRLANGRVGLQVLEVAADTCRCFPERELKSVNSLWISAVRK